MVDFGTIIPSVLGGGLLTAVGYMFKFSSKVDVMSSKLDGLKSSFENHIASAPVCPYHTEICQKVAVLESKAEDNGKK